MSDSLNSQYTESCQGYARYQMPGIALLHQYANVYAYVALFICIYPYIYIYIRLHLMSELKLALLSNKHFIYSIHSA